MVGKREIPTVELLYVCDQNFKNKIDNIRIKLNIFADSEGVVSSENIIKFDLILICDEKIRMSYFKTVKSLCNDFGLDGLEDDVQMFIESGETPYSFKSDGTLDHIRKITRPKIGMPKLVSRDMRGNLAITGIEVRFKIKRQISKRDLDDWLKRYKEYILVRARDYMSEYKLGITRLNKAERVARVIQLKNKYPKMTFEQIADEICKKYPNDPDSVNGEINARSVYMIYSRYKKRFQQK